MELRSDLEGLEEARDQKLIGKLLKLIDLVPYVKQTSY